MDQHLQFHKKKDKRKRKEVQNDWLDPELVQENKRPSPAAAAEPNNGPRLEEAKSPDNGEHDATEAHASTRRTRKPVERLIEAMLAETSARTASDVEGEIFCLEALFPRDGNFPQNERQNPLLAFKASADPDKMHMHEAMKQPDREQFVAAMIKEVKDQMNNGNFSMRS